MKILIVKICFYIYLIISESLDFTGFGLFLLALTTFEC